MRTGRHRHLIHAGLPSPPASVPFHDDIEGIDRVAWRDFPVHLTLHHVDHVHDAPAPYVKRHCHHEPEINVLVAPPGELVYQVELEDETYVVESPAAIWIPAGLMHAANIVRGTGCYLCTVLSRSYLALGDPRLRTTDTPGERNEPGADLPRAS